MSDRKRPQAGGPPGPGEQRPGGGPPMMGPMMGGRGPVQKAKDFKGTLKKLLNYLKPHRIQLIIVIVFAILSTVFTIVGPKIMGLVTTRLFNGLMSKYGAVALHAPMPSIDFVYISRVIIVLVGFYIVSAFFSYIQQYQMASVSQKIVYDMRRQVDEKFSRLPLKYFDGRPHGEIMSRMTNDIDNISSTLQQSMTQLITSVFTILGVLVMMLTISPVLTLITLITLPLSFVVTTRIAKQSQKNFGAQAKEMCSTGTWKRCSPATRSCGPSATRPSP
jgi:ATP-binding cassette subfamily B multidrug efflux pump